MTQPTRQERRVKSAVACVTTLAFLMILGGCAVSERGASTEDTRPAGLPKMTLDCIFVRSIDDWKELDGYNLIIYAPRVHTPTTSSSTRTANRCISPTTLASCPTRTAASVPLAATPSLSAASAAQSARSGRTRPEAISRADTSSQATFDRSQDPADASLELATPRLASLRTTGSAPRVRVGAARRIATITLVLVATAVAALRYHYCTQPPANTRDVVRHMVYGRLVAERGLAIAGQALSQMDPPIKMVTWSNVPYNYPIVTLGFFTLVSALSHTIFFAKLALTVIEAINACLVYLCSGQRWLAVVYWASPVSMWWVSREGQFEPLQSLFALAALYLLPRTPAVAFALLALAVQVKLSAVLLLPLFLLSVVRGGWAALLPAAAGFGLAITPSVIALWYYPVRYYPLIAHVLRYNAPEVYNPYYWNVAARGVFGWNPPWLIAANQASTYGMLLVLSWLALRTRRPVQFVAPLAFLVLCKLHTNAQFWYMALLPSFLLPIENRTWRFWLIALVPLLDVHSFAEIVYGPFGYTVGDYYARLSAFDSIWIPR